MLLFFWKVKDINEIFVSLGYLLSNEAQSSWVLANDFHLYTNGLETSDPFLEVFRGIITTFKSSLTNTFQLSQWNQRNQHSIQIDFNCY